ncbi:hypothetical protein NQ358_24455, partial [Escherichia coli]|nr:hypothetical protein [Escherichia coli]
TQKSVHKADIGGKTFFKWCFGGRVAQTLGAEPGCRKDGPDGEGLISLTKRTGFRSGRSGSPRAAFPVRIASTVSGHAISQN